MDFFPELTRLENIAAVSPAIAKVEVPASVTYKDRKFPLYTFTFGTPRRDAPVLGLIGGVHGLEKIGAQIVTAFLENLIERLVWDESLHWMLERCRIVFMPLVNPVGTMRKSRSNGNDVDLMRNAPVQSLEATPWVGGQRYSRLFPWYMGDPAKMEVESKALCDFIRRECFSASHSIVLDVHSGFGLVDQIWFPYARSREHFPHLAEVTALKLLMDRVYPNHVYRFESQSFHYRTHGDLWDYLYDEYRRESQNVFLPLTLELGSWNWVRKNPTQLFNALGPFNPMKPHRQRRALRRHLPFFDFLCRATVSPSQWKLKTDEERERYRQEAIKLWYTK
jgi:hypothetical protein